ncbi:MAG: oxidoreductase [Gammaproteobacteria bacterium]|nr:oxidoreductase [Gammaproteobacteria bacterium]MBK52999.1 oxidoreductase [Gammaproteobacteria bacterium]|tara:strand:- start:606 stop:1799 length:1194 start_codon:yes stop_codon:yes gene_type:complete
MRFYDETSLQRSARVADFVAMGEPVCNLLIVGCGMIGREHMRVATLLGRARIHGIYDTEPKSIHEAVTEFASYTSEKLIVYPDLKSAVDDTAIDAIFVCTPNFTHFDILQRIKHTEKPLFIEKPMATRLDDAKSMVQLVGKYPSFIQLGMQYRFKSQYVEAFHEIRKKNSLGAVKTIAISEYRPPFLNKVRQWNKFNEFSGGTLVEKCCHYFDLINLMAGDRIESVYALSGQAVNFIGFRREGKESDIHDHAFVVMQYVDGISASFTLNMFSQELYEELNVTGEQGRLLATEHSSFTPGISSKANVMVEVEGHPAYRGTDITYPAPIEASGHNGATFFEHEAFVDQFENKPHDSANCEQGLWAILVASAAQESAATGQVISVKDFAAEQGLDEVLSW